MSDAARKRVSASMLRLRSRAPFFATLALFARLLVSDTVPTAATNGREIWVNPEFLLGLTPAETDGLLLHEVLHVALLHVPRRKERDPLVWNVAADIVVNGMIAALPGCALPEGGLRDRKLENFSVEEVYGLLRKEWRVMQVLCPDLLAEAPGTDWAEVEAHWRYARLQAANIASGHGKLPVGMERELGALEPARLDWRSHLWRYLARTPSDFEEFDRRFLSRGLYLEGLLGESLRVFLAVDTSGSISEAELALFMGEVEGILRSYPHVRSDLYYVDAEAYGPYDPGRWEGVPRPQGGGGTDFRPFFDAVHHRVQPAETCVAVYLTDGFGSFPEAPPEYPVLWVVTAGGLDLQEFPFGETVRLIFDDSGAR